MRIGQKVFYNRATINHTFKRDILYTISGIHYDQCSHNHILISLEEIDKKCHGEGTMCSVKGCDVRYDGMYFVPHIFTFIKDKLPKNIKTI